MGQANSQTIRMTLVDLYQIPFKIARKFKKNMVLFKISSKSKVFSKTMRGGARSGVWGSEGLGASGGLPEGRGFRGSGRSGRGRSNPP